MQILSAGVESVADDGRLDALEIPARAVELLLPAHHPLEFLVEEARDGCVRLSS